VTVSLCVTVGRRGELRRTAAIKNQLRPTAERSRRNSSDCQWLSQTQIGPMMRQRKGVDAWTVCSLWAACRPPMSCWTLHCARVSCNGINGAGINGVIGDHRTHYHAYIGHITHTRCHTRNDTCTHANAVHSSTHINTVSTSSSSKSALASVQLRCYFSVPLSTPELLRLLLLSIAQPEFLLSHLPYALRIVDGIAADGWW
jgi:hypothetical protein